MAWQRSANAIVDGLCREKAIGAECQGKSNKGARLHMAWSRVMKCPACGSDNPPDNSYCGKCGGEIVSYLDDTDSCPAKRLELPRWWWWVKTDVTVRPDSHEHFIEVRARPPGAKARITHSRRGWMAGNFLIISFFLFMSIFTLWMFNYIGVWWISILLIALYSLAFLPQILLFIWSLRLIDDAD